MYKLLPILLLAYGLCGLDSKDTPHYFAKLHRDILNEIDKLRAFIIYLELDFKDKCNKFLGDFHSKINGLQDLTISLIFG